MCTVGGEEALVGNARLLAEHGVAVRECAGGTLVYVALGGKYLGCVVIEDKCKENAAQAIAALRAQGVQGCYMLTGDNRPRAEAIAQEAGLDGVYADLLPADKLDVAKRLREQGMLMYAGDGINDAPLLMEADVGVSMGGVGSDAAIEASDVVLMTGDLSLLPLARRIARRTRAVVLQNIVFSVAVKVAVMALGLCGLIPLGLAGRRGGDDARRAQFFPYPPAAAKGLTPQNGRRRTLARRTAARHARGTKMRKISFSEQVRSAPLHSCRRVYPARRALRGGVFCAVRSRKGIRKNACQMHLSYVILTKARIL